ncbi:RNA 2'-phosphotransferase [Jatrophihabitans sp. GAS493]|uniref:RNA 2'-phosphotransferase n=1 Tax=Jatrophihabitans sp. GAS493 TaxID=1907575 RepID=UPI000BB961CD|nr:RNA 2'-phosphotransferase [Jatrophihabitans sp. GAS493]
MSRRSELSHRLSYVLRHDPASVGLTLDGAGWVDVTHLLEALRAVGVDCDRAGLLDVVAASSKQRFTLDPITDRLRAAQGHSIPVDLGLEAAAPPATLYHGTTEAAWEQIEDTGLTKQARQHVHLSPDRDTAQVVAGRRRGPVIILQIDAARMAADGHVFFVSDNGVWLTDAVPARYLSLAG